jgi:hypothetical protein
LVANFILWQIHANSLDKFLVNVKIPTIGGISAQKKKNSSQFPKGKTGFKKQIPL